MGPHPPPRRDPVREDEVTWDAIVILRPELSPEQRKAVVHKIVAAVEADIDKGVDGGGTLFTASLTGDIKRQEEPWHSC